MLLMTLEYLREYRTYFHISVSYGLSESNTYKVIRWMEDTLIKSQVFSLAGGKALLKSDVDYAVILVDASETPIQRPKKNRDNYSGKKKRHTLKSQVVVDKRSQHVICRNFCNGKRHHFRLFKESRVRFLRDTLVLTDTGYQGLHKLHANSELPKKKTKRQHLTREDKQQNIKLSSQRVLNENVIGVLKRFRIIADKYRNRCRRFGL